VSVEIIMALVDGMAKVGVPAAALFVVLYLFFKVVVPKLDTIIGLLTEIVTILRVVHGIPAPPSPEKKNV
jgi:hypothetical protein